jgi:glutaredoxin
LSIKIYTREGCSHCTLAKEFMKKQNISFEEIKIDVDISVDTVKTMFPEARTVPIILKDDVWIGGYDAMVGAMSND